MQIITTQSCHHLQNRSSPAMRDRVPKAQWSKNSYKKYNKAIGFKNIWHIHILFTMLIIVNITTNRLTASTTSKTCYMLDFNEVFWHADKTRITRITQKNTRIMRKNTRITRKITRITVDSKNFFADALRRGRRQCGRGAAWTAISQRGRGAARTRIICPPLVQSSTAKLATASAIPPESTRGDERQKVHAHNLAAKLQTQSQSWKMLHDWVNEQESQWTTTRCSSPLRNPSQHLQSPRSTPFHSFIVQLQIWHRGPRPLAHWYMCTDLQPW